MSRLDTALALAARGFKVFPIAAGAKFPPLARDWPRIATTTPAEAWWTSGNSSNNIGIHCDGLCVIDVDVKNDGDVSLAALDAIYEIPETLTTLTPTGGRHLFYRLPEGHPGVPNSVGKLGKGLDIRSTHGYVVAPGSEVPAGRYRFAADTPIAPAPEWLLAKLGAVAAARTAPPAPVPDAEQGVVARAAAWLAGHEPAVSGAGGDLHTYRTACRLRDFGLSAEQALELMADEWNGRCSPPWEHAELEGKVRNAYRYSQEENAGKSKPVTASDFDAVVAPLGVDVPTGTQGAAGDVQAAPRAGRGPLRLDAFAADTATLPGYVVKGFLSRASYAVVHGVPGAGKTFAALDLAYHVAAGLPWMERRVNQGVVLYLPYEGAGGMRKRAQALQKQYGSAAVPFFIDDSRYNIRDADGRKSLGLALAALPDKPSLIVFDTFAHALCGGDENSAQDVGAFNAAVAGLIEATGACVVVLHHPAKSGNGGPRGSGALPGAIDTELEVADRTIYSRKQRDFDLAEPVGFALQSVQVGVDGDGEAITSCVVQPRSAAGGTRMLKAGTNIKRAFDALCEARPTNEPITAAEWREKCLDFMPASRGAWHDVRTRLTRLGLITIDTEGLIRRNIE